MVFPPHHVSVRHRCRCTNVRRSSWFIFTSNGVRANSVGVPVRSFLPLPLPRFLGCSIAAALLSSATHQEPHSRRQSCLVSISEKRTSFPPRIPSTFFANHMSHAVATVRISSFAANCLLTRSVWTPSRRSIWGASAVLFRFPVVFTCFTRHRPIAFVGRLYHPLITVRGVNGCSRDKAVVCPSPTSAGRRCNFCSGPVPR